MPNLYVTIYDTAGGCPKVPPLAEWSLEIGIDSNRSAPFPDHARSILVKAGTVCCLGFGEEAEAVNGFHPLDAGETRQYMVSPGHSIAVIVRSDESTVHMPSPQRMPQPFT